MIALTHRVFLEVASHLSFSKASKALFISQPAVSKQIKILEDQYKLALFERKGNSILITEAGQKLYQYLLEAREIEKKIAFDLLTLGKGESAAGFLKLGASTTIALYVLPSILSGFQQKFQNVDVQLVNRNSENVMNALLNHEIDVGIVEVENKLTTVSYQHFLNDEVIAVCSGKSALAGKSLTIEELKTVPLALRERGSGTLHALLHELAGYHIKPSDLKVKIRLGGTEALKNFLLADECLGFLPRPSILRELSSGELVEVPVTGLAIKREFYFIRRKGSEEYGLTKQFIRYCLNSL
ncbi:MAG: LysR substrate-binding domain-containing protein [Mucilaginibacter sp.]|uniref:LysR substrate-binding domain-containing protein n=1 Tax=Mucilaginibacter sp. TaxID=1882438 RepID=UPI0034E4BADE